MMKDEGFLLLRGFGFADRQIDRQMDQWTDICECRVAFATKKWLKKLSIFPKLKL